MYIKVSRKEWVEAEKERMASGSSCFLAYILNMDEETYEKSYKLGNKAIRSLGLLGDSHNQSSSDFY